MLKCIIIIVVSSSSSSRSIRVNCHNHDLTMNLTVVAMCRWCGHKSWTLALSDEDGSQYNPMWDCVTKTAVPYNAADIQS